MPVRRLINGFLVAGVLFAVVFVFVGSETLGPWGQMALVFTGMIIVALFAPAYFGIDRESHRRR